MDGLLIWLNRLFELNPVALGVFLAGLTLTSWARARMDAALAKGARVSSRRWTTGAEAAEEILDATDLEDVAVSCARGPLADYYDPASRAIRLGAFAFGGRSLASLGLAAHEAGHALQHARRDPPLPLAIRDGLALAARLGPAASGLTAVVGFVLVVPVLTTLGLVAFGLTSALPLLGLPIERDASRRARRALAMTALVDSGQDALVAEVLDAVTWSTVAAGLPRLRAPAWRRMTPEEVPA